MNEAIYFFNVLEHLPAGVVQNCIPKGFNNH